MKKLMKKPNREQASIQKNEKIRELIGKGLNDFEICETLNINGVQLAKRKREIQDYDRLVFEHLDSAAVYSEYLSKARVMVRRLQSISKRFENKAQWTALVAAIKQEKDIYDTCIKYGQDFGYIDRKAQQLEVSSEVNVTNTTEATIRVEIEREVKALNELARGRVVDMRPELLGVTEDDVRKFVPAHMLALPPAKEGEAVTRNTKIQTKVTLKRR